MLMKHGNAAGALENYRQALATLEGGTDKNESTETLAEVYEGIADAQIMLSKKSGSLSEVEMYQKSLSVWTDLQQRGMLTPNYANRPNEVKQKIERGSRLRYGARVVTTLRRLRGSSPG